MLDAFYQSLVCFIVPYLVRIVWLWLHIICDVELMMHYWSYSAGLLSKTWQSVFLPQVYQDTDIDVFTFGTPLNTVSLFTILLHLSIEIKAWVSPSQCTTSEPKSLSTSVSITKFLNNDLYCIFYCCAYPVDRGSLGDHGGQCSSIFHRDTDLQRHLHHL